MFKWFKMHEWMYNGSMCEWMGEWKNESMNERMNERTNESVNGGMRAQMTACLTGWMIEWATPWSQTIPKFLSQAFSKPPFHWYISSLSYLFAELSLFWGTSSSSLSCFLSGLIFLWASSLSRLLLSGGSCSPIFSSCRHQANPPLATPPYL